ncbi:MAG: hypothetical protein P8Y72_17470 [Anaerolineales bacterium]
MWKPKYQVLTILLMLAFILAACGGGSSAMSPEELIAASATHMNDLAGFEFGLKYDGEPVIMDADGLTKFTSATGQFNAPDQVSATVKASAASMVVEIKMIGTNGLSGGMIDPGTLDIGLWIDAETLDVHRVQVEDATGGTWQLDMWNFGSTFDIQPPL